LYLRVRKVETEHRMFTEVPGGELIGESIKLVCIKGSRRRKS